MAGASFLRAMVDHQVWPRVVALAGVAHPMDAVAPPAQDARQVWPSVDAQAVVASPMGDSAAAGAIRADDEVDASPGVGADSANAASASADGTTGDQSSGRPNRHR